MEKKVREKKYPCDVCGSAFFKKSHFEGHMRTHTGEKPFSCNVCDAVFSQSSILNRHMRTHTGEKPYTCELCQMTFSRRFTLTLHMRKHKEGYPRKRGPKPKVDISTGLPKAAGSRRSNRSCVNANSYSSLTSSTVENFSPPVNNTKGVDTDVDISEEEPTVAARPPPLMVPNHQQSVMFNLSSLWKAGRLCDAMISNGEVDIKVHKVILGAVCPQLLPVLHNSYHDKLPRVSFPSSVSKEALLAFAEYMYNGVLDSDPDLLVQMKTIAQHLYMKHFEQLCNNQLKSSLLQNMSPTIDESMLSEPSYLSGNDQESSPQSNQTPIMETIPTSSRAHEKDVHIPDSLNSISNVDKNSNVPHSSPSEDSTRADDNLMEIVNTICDLSRKRKPQMKLENVDSMKNEQYDRKTRSSDINYSSSTDITTSNSPHFSSPILPQSSSFATSTSKHTSNFPHLSNTVFPESLSPATSTSKHTSNFQSFSNTDGENRVRNTNLNNPYSINPQTAQWPNIP